MLGIIKWVIRMEIKKDFIKYEPFIKSQIFEKFIFALFQTLGYELRYKKSAVDNYIDLELTYNKSEKAQKYICQIRYFSRLYSYPTFLGSNIYKLSGILKKDQTGLFITNAICSPEIRTQALDNNVMILDISNLLYLVKTNSDMYQSFLELLDFSVSNISLKEPSIPYLFKNIKKEIDDVIVWEEKFEKIEPGKKEFVKYQNTCIEALKLLFSDYLSIWEEQQNSNDNLYRFDLICKIKNDINDDFFETLNNYFNTRYIVFDFKNYTDEITQKEIYTTEKYLYDKALRKVAIIISRKGIDENALKAIKGSLREQGKVIITLTDLDVTAMIKMHYEGNNPSDYLSMKLDKLLIELEK